MWSLGACASHLSYTLHPYPKTLLLHGDLECLEFFTLVRGIDTGIEFRVSGLGFEVEGLGIRD